MSAIVDVVALTLLPIWRWRLIVEQLRAGRPAPEILEQECDERHCPQLLRARAAAALDRAERAGLRAIPWNSPDYSPALATIVDSPPMLWVRGVVSSLQTPAVAVIGSRAGSPYALAAAEQLSADLAARGVVVVSGLARGVDSAAHHGALSAGGPTVAVLGCGADIVYPREHGELANRISESGALVSEFVPGTPPQPHFFPRRNRVISGLSRAVVVIEAGEKSGSLITARCALDQGRDVLAVPGNILNGRNRGGHALLRDGAKIVETVDDILEELGLPVVASSLQERAGDATVGDSSAVSGSDPVLTCLTAGESCDLDDISQRSGLPSPQLLARLFELELEGRVKRVGGGRFVRLPDHARF